MPDGSNATVITSEAPASQEHPDWSPDGLRIVFDTAFSLLWTVNADGSELTTVYECVAPCHTLQDGSWSPDGTEIAFMVSESQDGSTTSRSAVLAVNASTGGIRTIYEDTSGMAWLFHPRWSVDGTSIVFEEDTYVSDRLTEEKVATMAIVVVAADGGAAPEYLATLTGPFQGPGSPAPDWSPVDDLIVFSRADNLFTIRPDGSGEVQVTNFDAVEEHAIQPTFTPDGTAIAYTYVTGEFGVNDAPTAAVIGLDGSGQVTVGGGLKITHPRFRP
jgi:TolB protein